jgi:UDP-N-acetylmuramate dehydrogenase
MLKAHVPGTHTRDEPLSGRTSVRVGGPADLFVQPADLPALQRALQILGDAAMPWAVLGGGANTLVGDGGFRGAILRLPNVPEEIVEEEGGVAVTLGAGSPIAKLLQIQRRLALTGAEFMAGIPGTLGGAVCMNAGTKNGWLQYILREVTLVRPESVSTAARDTLQFQYRHTALPAGSVVARVTCLLSRGDVAVSEKKIADDLGYRRSTQPLHQPSFGSAFINPPNGSAGRLIEAAGLKGHRLGNAQISEMHANFIVNLGEARAADVRGLLELARGRVREQSGIELKHEVQFLGEF